MLVIGDGSGYAVLHTKVTLPLGSAPTYRLTQLSATDQAWAADLNSRRATAGTYALPVDEFAQESTRACALYEANGPTGPAQSYCGSADVYGGYAKYQAQYTANGGMWNYVAEGLSGQPDYPTADGEFFNPTDPGYGFSTSTNAVYLGVGQAPFAALPGSGLSTFVFGQAQQ